MKDATRHDKSKPPQHTNEAKQRWIKTAQHAIAVCRISAKQEWAALVLLEKLWIFGFGPDAEPRMFVVPHEWEKEIVNKNFVEAGGFRSLRWQKKRLDQTIDKARRGDAIADKALCDLAADGLKNSGKIPDKLAQYAADHLRGRLPNMKRKRKKNSIRDMNIAMAVKIISLHAGLNPTRSPATSDKECGCSIVAEAENMEEEAVKKIWQKHKSIFNDPGLWKIVRNYSEGKIPNNLLESS